MISKTNSEKEVMSFTYAEQELLTMASAWQ